MEHKANPGDWDLTANQDGELLIGMHIVTELAGRFGTPLYVLNEPRLEEQARQFSEAIKKYYPVQYSVHYPFKCNSVPAVLQAIKKKRIKGRGNDRI